MDVVYVCRAGTNPELRYSLRSLTNVPHGRVWILGGWPGWVRNVETVEVPQLGTKYANTTRAVREACSHPGISDPFWLWNDDMYAIQPTTGGHFHRGRVRDVLDLYERRYPGGPYAVGMRATLERLEEHGYVDPWSYELHVPLIVHKAPMIEALDLGADVPVWHKRTAYGAVANVGGSFMEDVKVYEAGGRVPVGPWLSSSDGSFSGLEAFLGGLFPAAGPYELAVNPACRTRGS